MRFIKLTVYLRSPDALYEYNKAGRSFWDDLRSMLQEKRGDLAMEKRGKFQCCFYLPFPEDDPAAVSEVMELIARLGSRENDFIVSSASLRAEDISALQNSNVDHITEKSWFRDAVSLFSSAQSGNTQPVPAGKKPQEQPRQPQFAPGNKPQTQPEEKPAPAKEAVRQPAPKKGVSSVTPIPPIGEDLASEAQRISTLRKELLNRVFGQRHAVDEVVQTIFECDAFNRNNNDRKGPLATFLFTGPSGVGKTHLAMTCAALLGCEDPLKVDMSEFSDNLSNGKFNGDYQQPAIVTGYVRTHPNGIIIFDEIEKAHLNTIHLFLQILDSGVLKDMKVNKEISFRDTIIFITTNAGGSLYEDPTVVDLSNVSRKTILEALRTDIKPGTNNEPYFPECITTRFANGHVILFNHLEPYALLEIIRKEASDQVKLFEETYHVKVNYDAQALSALVLYSTGGLADARSLRSTAKNVIVKELQDIILQTYAQSGKDVNTLKEITIRVEPERSGKEVLDLFKGNDVAHVPIFADPYVIEKARPLLDGGRTKYECFNDPDAFKRRVRGVVDYILIDPAAGSRAMDRIPNDMEDIDADGVDLFRYIREFYPEIPVYFLDVRGKGSPAFASLLARGGRGVIEIDPEAPEKAKSQLSALEFSALVNNATFQLGRSGKILSYNCSQFSPDASHAVISFDRLSLGYAPSSSDSDVIVRTDDKNGVVFDDVVGCKEAKKALQDFCKYVADPRRMMAQGKKIPKGVLLYGPPGTGKTMLAKALANEAKAAFIPTTATSLFGSLVGESEKNVRELFRRARRYAPSVIFIDEVDAIARKRTGTIGTTHNEDTLNAFIAEMDGFTTDERRPVFILAATNYDISGEGAKVLDPAFVRRFDRRIYVDLPDTEDRYKLLTLLLGKHGVNLGPDHDAILKNLAERSSGMSNADLSIVIDMFLRNCEEKTPTGSDLMDALDAFRFGEVNELDPDDLRQTACHESGHALVARLLGETPAFLTVVSRGSYGGFMEHAHDERKVTSTYDDLMNRVCISLAGRAAEIEVYGRTAGLNTGASGDLANARYLVKLALRDFAMGDKLFAAVKPEECEALLQQQYQKTATLISEHRAILEALTDLLTKEKSLDKSTLKTFFTAHGV